jgi:hypothetical protein
MRSVYAMYDDISMARTVVDEMVAAGFNPNSVSVVVGDANRGYSKYVSEESRTADGSDAAEGAGIGAIIGGIGGLLLGLGALAIPGVGPAIAAGPIVAALGGAGIGAAAGGLIGALAEVGLEEGHVESFAEGIRRGHAAVIAQVPEERAGEARAIMERYQPMDVERQSEEWRRSGWSGRFESEPTETRDYDRNRDGLLGGQEVDRVTSRYEQTGRAPL